VFPPLRRPREIFAVAFNPPDGRWLAIGVANGTVELIDAQTGHRTDANVSGDQEIRMRGLAFRDDGRRLASLDNEGTITEWDVTREAETT
jgi:WD40 repeat protein